MCFLTATQNKGLRSWRLTKHHKQQGVDSISHQPPFSMLQENNFQTALGSTVV